MTQNITRIINEEEKRMLEAAALISSCYAPWALNYNMVAKPSQMFGQALLAACSTISGICLNI
jgi:hypothetical protein